MKKLSAALLFCILLLSLFCINACAVTEYNNKGFYLEIPDWLTYDENWAKENSYTGYWHNEDYKFEVFIWSDSYGAGPFDIPENSKVLCYHHKLVDTVTVSQNYAKTEKINSLICSISSGIFSADDEHLFDYYVYKFEENGKHYLIRFVVHDKEYEYYVNEIACTFKAVSDFSFNDIFRFIFFENIKNTNYSPFVYVVILAVLAFLGYFAIADMKRKKR